MNFAKTNQQDGGDQNEDQDEDDGDMFSYFKQVSAPPKT